MATVAFDCDGTLITYDNKPRYDVLRLFHAFEALGCEMYIWSGGGVDYARTVRARLGLKAFVRAKGSFQPDIAVDDQYVALGVSQIMVGEAPLYEETQDERSEVVQPAGE